MAAPPQTRMPTLAALRAFEAAARLGSVRRAAEELRVTPAAVTQQIRALEADLGLPLVRKRGNALELTEAGLRGKDPLINAFRQMQQAVERMRTVLEESGGGGRNTTAAMANLAEAIQGLVAHMRTEQQMIREWADCQGEQNREIKKLLERIARHPEKS